MEEKIKQVLPFLPAAALLYGVVAFVINVGYIEEVGYWSVTLFGIPEMIQVSIAMVMVLLLYGLLFIFYYLIIHPFLKMVKIYKSIIDGLYSFFSNDKVALAALMLMGVGTFKIFEAMKYISHGNIYIDIIPNILVIGNSMIYAIWITSTTYMGRFVRFAFAVAVVVNISGLGNVWAKSDRASQSNIVSLNLSNGGCITSRLARSVSSGMILYNEYSRSYEFRRLDSIRSISPGYSCL